MASTAVAASTIKIYVRMAAAFVMLAHDFPLPVYANLGLPEQIPVSQIAKGACFRFISGFLKLIWAHWASRELWQAVPVQA